MPIIWTLNCFRFYTWPSKQLFFLYLRRILDNESFWMLLKLRFLAFKKSCTSGPNWGEGGGNLDKIQKDGSFFSSLNHQIYIWFILLILFLQLSFKLFVEGIPSSSYFCRNRPGVYTRMTQFKSWIIREAEYLLSLWPQNKSHHLISNVTNVSSYHHISTQNIDNCYRSTEKD